MKREDFKIYVASSWGNDRQPLVVKFLRIFGYEVYDFKNPKDGDSGFNWSEIDPNWQDWEPEEYIGNLSHPLAVGGFYKDFDAMEAAHACVLVWPCGSSAHLEAGCFVGAGKPLITLIHHGCKPELMIKMSNGITAELEELPKLLDGYRLSGREGWNAAILGHQP